MTKQEKIEQSELEATQRARALWGLDARAYNYGNTLFRVGNGPTDSTSTVWGYSRESFDDAFRIATESAAHSIIYGNKK